MSYRITCYTMFDITKTGVFTRAKPELGTDQLEWLKNRNTQANFDTILQIINLRSQPENISNPKKNKLSISEVKYFGYNYKKIQSYWTFTFEIAHHSVFDDGINELGSLYNDCNGVPMILCGTEHKELLTFLDTTVEFRNIYFGINNE